MLFGTLQRVERHIGGTFKCENLLAGHTNRHHAMFGRAGSPSQHVKHLFAARGSQTGHVGNIGEHRHIECAECVLSAPEIPAPKISSVAGT